MPLLLGHKAAKPRIGPPKPPAPWLIPLTLLGLTSCGPDETISGYATPDATYTLTELDGAPFPANATIRFPETGQVTGTAPCNQYNAAQTAPYPWFALGPIAATRRACTDLAAEQQFFEALATMTIAEVAGTTLILSHTDGGQMVFQSD